jgi:hypothetical protein
MAHTLDSMDLKQIITLHPERLSNRKIGQYAPGFYLHFPG